MKLVTVEQMKSIEAASDAAGHSYAAMMDRAGAAVAGVALREQRPAASSKRVLVLVGPGNNGGDGLVAAVRLREAGVDVACYLLKTRDDARVAAARDAGAFIVALPDDRGLRVLRLHSQGADVIVDALFGTGARLPLSPEAQKILNTVKGDIEARRSQPPTATIGSQDSEWIAPARPAPMSTAPLIVAVDGPSGMDFDTGALDPGALRADVSVTFAYSKIGHTRFPAAEACGELIVADIGTDPSLAANVSIEIADADMIRALLPARPANAHKGTFGKIMIAGGSTYYPGAPALAASAAYRSGAGLVTVAAPSGVLQTVAAKLTEATSLPLPDELGVVAPDAAPALAETLPGYEVLLLGPGLTHTQAATAFVERLLGAQHPLPPLVVDADGLNILADMQEWWTRLPLPSVLTPHPGEMARLTKLSVSQIEADRIEAATRFAREWGHVVVLKGAFTIVAAPDGRPVVMPFANPALATAGSGDVLAGTIAGLRAQRLGAFEAALCGAYLHGLAGEFARQDIGSTGVLASDLLPRLPAALKSIRG